MTRQRDALAALLSEVVDFRDAQQLHALLRARGQRIGLTTVYRQLTAMAAAGEVDTLRGADGQVRYRRCATASHHHHLVCRDCGRTIEVAGPAVERWSAAVAAQHDFADVTHTAEVFGRCPNCRQTAQARPNRRSRLA